jgi:Ca2+-transporting ATPase
LAVAAIPEGLPAVVALSLALGAKIMFKEKALIRRLSVVESIGAVDIICTDKTGTITKNEMTVTDLYINGHSIQVGKHELSDEIKQEIKPLINCGVLCNNAIGQGHPDTERSFLGEQTEISLLRAGENLGVTQDKLEEEFSRIDEISFSSERKMMSVVVAKKKGKLENYLVYSKGAPEVVLEKCNRILIDGKVKRISEKDKEKILRRNENLASNALRVLGFAYKETENIEDKDNLEEKLVWIGLQAMIDPPHAEMEGVVSECATAGIRIVMITGDNPVTAQAIANLVEIKTEGVLLGKDIDKLSDSELRAKLKAGVNIFARTTPMHKMRILQVLEKKYRVAMTGDGVNDSLALKQANVGVAMGQKGTAVAKEASDIILLDDNFSTIVAAVKEGRRIFDNIRKFINYLLVSNFAEVSVLFLATFLFTLDEPILMPAQILWINLLTDGLPALALGVDPANRDIMKFKPRPKNEPIINKKLGWLIGVMGIKKTIILLVTFLIVLSSGENLARTTLFTGFILYEFIRIASIRSQEKLSWFSNPWLLFALLSSLCLQLLIIYSPLSVFFNLEPLGFSQWLVLGAGMVIGYILAIIITKVIDNLFKEKEKAK